jgi:hypothetical protein
VGSLGRKQGTAGRFDVMSRLDSSRLYPIARTEHRGFASGLSRGYASLLVVSLLLTSSLAFLCCIGRLEQGCRSHVDRGIRVLHPATSVGTKERCCCTFPQERDRGVQCCLNERQPNRAVPSPRLVDPTVPSSSSQRMPAFENAAQRVGFNPGVLAMSRGDTYLLCRSLRI